MFVAPGQWVAQSRAGAAVWSVLALALLTQPGQAAESPEPARGQRRVGIDTRFGDLVHEARGHYRAKRFGRAAALYTEALAMRPDPKNTHMLYFERGTTQMDGQNHPAAVADFDQAVRLRPSDWEAINMAAWLRATSRNAAARNGRLAVQQATRACELTKWKNPDVLDTLAAAHAEAGDFERAVQFQKQAIGLAPLGERIKMHERLRLFEQRTPYRLKSGR